MAELTLEVSRREEQGKGPAGRLRREGKVPAVVYGGHRETVPITVDRKAVTDMIQKSEHDVRFSEGALPQGVKVLDDPDRVVVGVTHQKAEIVETPEVVAGVEAVPAEPEVIARGKKPEEEPAE